ncbi:TPA_exp: hypothetical protein A8136_4367 [Trichophyton benhamiae CBS 112371]|nr:TPA_exp: hypothetical protein A8136_4367 [Trichophyton benhamiae CBS 112371]
MQTTTKRFFSIVGRVSVGDVQLKNGSGWGSGFSIALPQLREKYPTAISAIIQGSQAHKSTKDPSDTKSVVTLAMYDEKGVRVGSAHIHEDGTFTDKMTRSGRGQLSSAAAAAKQNEDED